MGEVLGARLRITPEKPAFECPINYRYALLGVMHANYQMHANQETYMKCEYVN